VDPFDAQPTQAGLALVANRLRAQVAIWGAVWLRLPSALRAHEQLVARRVALQRPPDDLLAVPDAVDSGRVDPVDAFRHGSADRSDRFGVIDRAPAEPPRAADRPGTKTKARKRGPRTAQRCGRNHPSSPLDGSLSLHHRKAARHAGGGVVV